MREHLISYIDLLFRGAENCEDIKQEILQNTLDRYDDLISQGKSPEAAYQLAITGIGDLSELLGKRPSTTPPIPQNQAAEKPMWKRVLFAIAIFLYIVSAIPLFVLGSMNMGLLGLCGTLAIAAVATPLLLLSFGGTKTNTVPKEKPSDSKAGTICWVVGLFLYFILSFSTGAWYITWIIFCMIPCASGICNGIFAIYKGSNKSVVKVIVLILVLCLLLFLLVLGINGKGLSFGYTEFDGLPGGTEASFGEMEGSAIKNIDIRWVSGKIILRRDSSARMLTFQEEAGTNTKSLAYRVDGDTLTIAFVKEAEWSFGINTEWSDKTLIITVPTFWDGDTIRINSVSAEVDISDMIGDSLDLISVSGDITVAGSGFNHIDIESVSGDIEYSGIFLDFQAETVSGNCEIASDIACEEIEFESVSGNLKMTLPENMGFTLNLDSVSGDLITDIAVSSSKSSKTYGNGECSISSDTVSGDVHIEHSK